MKERPKKVLVFGTFDIIHPGHIYFLKQAKKYGHLTVVIARDRTVKKIKKHLPENSEKVRKKNIAKLKIAQKVILGDLKDPYKVLEKEKPDIICLGYDQKAFVENLSKILKEKKIKCLIIRLKPYQPHKYKSSLIKKRRSALD